MNVILIGLLLTLVVLPMHSAAQPKATIQVVYGLSVFDGEGYSPAFAPQAARTIYLLGGAVNVLAARRTQVYFWPLGEQYLPDWAALNEELGGQLRIKGGEELVQEIEKRPYALVYPRGPQGPRELAVGEEASARYADFEQQQREYEDAVERYYADYARYLERVQRQKSELATVKETPLREPVKPLGFVSKPAKAFLVNLPVGKYSIALINEHGKEVEGSERDLVVFRPRRRGIGYKIIPFTRWTEPLHSPAEADAIYAVGESTVYLQPYAAQEFNEALYVRLRNPQDRKASETRWIWVPGRADFSRILQIQGKARPATRARPALFLVEQTEGTQLGYRITKQARSTLEPHEHGFTAYEVDTPSSDQLRISLLCEREEICPTSEREIVIIRGAPFLLYGAACFPLLIGGGLVAYRRISTRAARASKEVSPSE